MKQFFDGMRRNDASMASAYQLRGEIIGRYLSKDSFSTETPALWKMPGRDARFLFLLSQTDPQSVPPEMNKAMMVAVYDSIHLLFSLNFALKQEFGILPAEEYGRLFEILHRMSWVNDPYLHALNRYYKGLVLLNLGDPLQGIPYLYRSRDLLADLLTSAQEKLTWKRIMDRMAEIEWVLGNEEQAESLYVAILKIDPQDLSALYSLSELLYVTEKCIEPGVWVEAFIKSNQELFDVVVHCGNRQIPDDQFEPTGPLMAALRHGAPASCRHYGPPASSRQADILASRAGHAQDRRRYLL